MSRHLFRRHGTRKNPIMILAYRGYGNQHMLYLKGRVLEDRGIIVTADDDSAWDNLMNMVKRFTSAAVPGAQLRARFQDIEHDVLTDKNGYFEVWIEPSQPLQDGRVWQEIELELLAPIRAGTEPVKTIASVLVPPPNAQFAVISDIDDTVIYTNAVSLLRMASTVLLGNARTRLPLKGVAAFYRALFRGSGLQGINPLFYVSNGAWNLYDFLSEFFHLHDIPIGPVLILRHWGFSRKAISSTGKREHKLAAARSILDMFTNLPFILVGDSGEKDPEIYAELVSLYPDRIRAVYIRNTSRSRKRPEQLRALADKVLQAGSTLIMADDTWPMAQHAAQQGWITPDALAEIDAEEQKDAALTGPIEKLLGEG